MKRGLLLESSNLTLACSRGRRTTRRNDFLISFTPTLFRSHTPERKQQFEVEQLLLIELCDEVTDLDPSQCD
jgi:hypothetical protein